MHLTKASIAAILAFTSSVAALPRISKAIPTLTARDVANGTYSNLTIPRNPTTITPTATPTTTQSLSSTSNNSQAATPGGPACDELMNLAIYIEQQPILEGLSCIITCWKENKDEDGKSDKAAYGNCIGGCGTNETFEAPTGEQNIAEKGKRSMQAQYHFIANCHIVSKTAIEAGAKLRNNVVQYFECMLEKESEECIAAIVGWSSGWMPDGYESHTTPAISIPRSSAPTESTSETEKE